MTPAPCPGCRWSWPVVMCPDGRFRAAPLEKSSAGRAWLAAGKAPSLLELQVCTAPRGPSSTPTLETSAGSAIARAQLHALAAHPDATSTERHFAAEMLRGPVTLQIATLCRAGVERVLGVAEIGRRP